MTLRADPAPTSGGRIAVRGGSRRYSRAHRQEGGPPLSPMLAGARSGRLVAAAGRVGMTAKGETVCDAAWSTRHSGLEVGGTVAKTYWDYPAGRLIRTVGQRCPSRSSSLLPNLRPTLPGDRGDRHMALAHAILATMLQGPMTGYDLAKQLSQTSGFFWRATHQQIYLELAKLEGKGFLEAVPDESPVRPDRVQRVITDAGRDLLHDWVKAPTEPASIKEDILVKCLALGVASQPELAEQIRLRRALHGERLGRYESLVATRFPDPTALSDAALGRYIALRAGIRYERQWVDWADEAMALLDTGTETPTPTRPEPRRRGTRSRSNV